MKRNTSILLIVVLFTTVLFADPPSLPDQNEVVAEIFGKNILRKEIEPSEELRKRDEKLFPNQKWSDLVIQYRNDNLSSLIWEPLKKQFLKEQNIYVTEKDLDEFVDAMMEEHPKIKEMNEKFIKSKEEQLKQEGLTLEQKEDLKQSIKFLKKYLAVSDKQRRKVYRDIGKSMVEMWKINQALYKIYGGRVIWQQGGIEPVDAYRQFLEEHEKKGDFKIIDEGLREGFWAYWVTMKHIEVSKEKIDFTTPWWLKAKEK